jgi:hypothetical protein
MFNHFYFFKINKRDELKKDQIYLIFTLKLCLYFKHFLMTNALINVKLKNLYQNQKPRLLKEEACEEYAVNHFFCFKSLIQSAIWCK